MNFKCFLKPLIQASSSQQSVFVLTNLAFPVKNVFEFQFYFFEFTFEV